MSDSTPAASAPRAIVAFSTPADTRSRPVQIFINRNEKQGAPDFDGKIGEKRVGVYIRNGSKGAFLSLVGDKLPDGKYEQLGTANITPVKGGVAKLVIKLVDSPQDSIWAEIGENVPEELLVRAGLDLEKLAKKKAEAEAEAGGTPA